MSRKRSLEADGQPPIPEREQPAIFRSVDADDPPGRLPTLTDYKPVILVGRKRREGFHLKTRRGRGRR